MAPLGAANFCPDDTPLDIVLYSGRWYKHRHLVILNLMLVIPLVTSYANGYDGSMMNGLQSVDGWKEYFGHPTPKELGLFNAIQSIGSLAAIPPAPFLSDRFGRRAGIFVGSSITLGGAITQTLTTNLHTFVAARFMIGFGTTLAMMASPLLISELAYPTHRAPLTALYNSLWFSGQIVAGGLVDIWHLSNPQRMVVAYSIGPPRGFERAPVGVCMVHPGQPALWFLWDETKKPGGADEMARGGEENNGLVKFEYQEIKNALAAESQRGSAWIDLFRTAGNRRRMRIILAIALFSQWSGSGLISYYLERVLSGIRIESSRDQTLINGCLAIWNLMWAAGAAMFVDRLGRRKLFLTSNVGMLVGFSILTTCAAIFEKSRVERAGHGVIASLFLFQAAYAIGYTPLLVSYTVEILPFFLRAKGLAVMYLFVNAALIFNQYVRALVLCSESKLTLVVQTNPIALDALKWKYYLIYTVWLVFELVFIYLFAVETRNRSLEETAALFDGDAALPDMAMDTRTESFMAEHVSRESSRISSVPESGDKPRVFDGREGFQLYDLGSKAMHSYASSNRDDRSRGGRMVVALGRMSSPNRELSPMSAGSTSRERVSSPDEEAHDPLLGRSESPVQSHRRKHRRRRSRWTGIAYDTGYYLVRQPWFPTRPLSIVSRPSLVVPCSLTAAVHLPLSARSPRHLPCLCHHISRQLVQVGAVMASLLLRHRTLPPANYSTLPPVGVFLGVLTVASGYERRMMIRESYAAHPASRIPGTERTVVRFVMGRPTGADIQAVQIENDIYNDMVILPIKENMNDGKSFAYFEWAYHNALVPLPPPDYVLKVDDDSFVMLGEIEARLRVTPRSLTYWGYVVKKRFMGGESYALSFDLVQYIATSPVVRPNQRRRRPGHCTMDEVPPRANDIVWWSERCWIYDHPKPAPSTPAASSFLPKSRGSEPSRLGVARARTMGISWMFGGAASPPIVIAIPTRLPPTGLPLHPSAGQLDPRPSHGGSRRGIAHVPARPRPRPQEVYENRETWEEKFRGNKVGGSVVVHYVKSASGGSSASRFCWAGWVSG
ncbi:Transporter [Rhizoctonia solani]|uniref:Transporter n=1 Tax=Rhizoctonia solani TaxID=456999 RepID=A0A8H7IEM1_9AGAM|nr:Transporter [Rhizoctonia solani]